MGRLGHYGGEKKKEKREEEKKKKEEGRREEEENPGLEHLFCLEYLFLVWNLYVWICWLGN